VSEPPIEVIPASVPSSPPSDGTAAPQRSRWLWIGAALLLAISVASLVVAWVVQQRVDALQQELVRRQQESHSQATEARMLAKQAEEGTREAAAKVALLEARVSEVSIQRGQLEELIQSLSRSRDENVLIDIDAAIRVAMQQTAITGSAEPLVAALKQADERLARYNQPRLERVRRAIARDLDRVTSVGVPDLPSLSAKLDEVVRLVDGLSLLSTGAPRKPASAPAASQHAQQSSAPVNTDLPAWTRAWNDAWSSASQRLWSEVKSLVRVTRIEHPEAMLLAPEQAFFVRENLKLRLLNARLALLSRQYEAARSDIAAAKDSLERYFDRSSRRWMQANELIRQVGANARQVGVPRPDETLAALSAASAVR
jgi:uroporphyrin-3 C-methyltransferase